MLKLVLTCEHGGNIVPAAYGPLFGDPELLASHRGYDIGAKELFDVIKSIADAAFFADITRLLVELNRSLHNKALFSTITKTLPATQKQQILQEHYFPYRSAVEEQIKEFILEGLQVLHISVHSFTPVLQGKERQADIGLLYDPKRNIEKSFCHDWKKHLQELNPNLKVRFNYPYLGVSDGFPTYLRRKFKEGQYLGIELEVNQKFPLGGALEWQQLISHLKESLRRVYTSFKLQEK